MRCYKYVMSKSFHRIHFPPGYMGSTKRTFCGCDGARDFSENESEVDCAFCHKEFAWRQSVEEYNNQSVWQKITRKVRSFRYRNFPPSSWCAVHCGTQSPRCKKHCSMIQLIRRHR